MVDNKNSNKPSGLKIWDSGSGQLGNLYASVVFWKKISDGKSGREECRVEGAECMFAIRANMGYPPSSMDNDATLSGREIIGCKGEFKGGDDYAFCTRTDFNSIYVK